jgi:hypothetical protein
MLDPETEGRKENSLTELTDHPDVQKWLDQTFEANKAEKKRIFFVINKDRLDGNYLRVAMAVHEFRKNPLNSAQDKVLAQQLMSDCRAILAGKYSDKEARIQSKVDVFCLDNPKCRLNKGLEERFNAKAPSLSTSIIHDLKAARNQNLLQRAVEKIESVLSSRKEQYYTSVRELLTEAINQVATKKPDMTKAEVVRFLSDTLANVIYKKDVCGISKKSTSEIALEKLITRTQSEDTLTRKSGAIAQLKEIQKLWSSGSRK